MTSLKGSKVILLSCGCFNPPTIMHMRMFECARNCLESNFMYKVVEGIISPVSDLFGKPGLLPAAHRLRMVELATHTSSWVRSDPWECSQEEWNRTVLVLRHFQQTAQDWQNPVRIMLLCGGDTVDSFERIKPNGSRLWDIEDIIEIVNNFGLVIIKRKGSDPMTTLIRLNIPEIKLSNVHVIEDDVLPNEISSTRLRDAIKVGRSIKYCTFDKIIEYIYKNKLYV